MKIYQRCGYASQVIVYAAQRPEDCGVQQLEYCLLAMRGFRLLHLSIVRWKEGWRRSPLLYLFLRVICSDCHDERLARKKVLHRQTEYFEPIITDVADIFHSIPLYFLSIGCLLLSWHCIVRCLNCLQVSFRFVQRLSSEMKQMVCRLNTQYRHLPRPYRLK